MIRIKFPCGLILHNNDELEIREDGSYSIHYAESSLYDTTIKELVKRMEKAEAEVERLQEEFTQTFRANQQLQERVEIMQGLLGPLRRAAAGQFLTGDEASKDNLRLLNLVAELSSESAKKPPVELTGDWLKRDRKWTPPDWIETETL
jgi:predicted nuclease with TOPRIM domain